MIRRDGESIILADTITALPTRSAGRVVVSGSHGGKYPGYLAAKAGVRAVIFNEAGVGLHEAGRGSLPFLQSLGIAAGVVSSMSCRIGDASDMMQRGVISAANPLASALGVEVGQPCSAAAEGLTAADWNRALVEPFGEARATLDLGRTRRRIILVDSASLVEAEDRDQIVVTGSHGGLIGGNPGAALKVDAFAAVFNDAGMGPDNAGIARLPALDACGVAAIAVAARSARIGDARSTLESGIISAANLAAMNRGASVASDLAPLLYQWANR